eukprot:354060-Chlamydomonas_euryale.AAC.19
MTADPCGAFVWRLTLTRQIAAALSQLRRKAAVTRQGGIRFPHIWELRWKAAVTRQGGIHFPHIWELRWKAAVTRQGGIRFLVSPKLCVDCVPQGPGGRGSAGRDPLFFC